METSESSADYSGDGITRQKTELNYCLLPADDEATVRKMMDDHYIPNHTFFRYLGAKTGSFGHSFLLRIKLRLSQGNSIGAFANEELCGFMINAARDREEEENYLQNMTEVELKLHRLKSLISGGSLQGVLETESYWGQTLCVAAQYQRKGIGKELVRRSYKLAQQRGIKKLVTYTDYEPDKILAEGGLFPGYSVI